MLLAVGGLGSDQVYPAARRSHRESLHQATLTYDAIVAAASVPPSLRLISDPVRWRLLRELADSDLRVRELVAALGQPQNLVSYHLRRLRSGGLVTARRSNFDRRDTYYRLDLDACAQALAGAAAALHPGIAPPGAPVPVPGAPAPGAEAPAAAFPGAAGAEGRRTGGGAVPYRVLFVCTGNSGRSPMAAALLRHRAGRRVQAASAGTRPRPLHPAAAAVLRNRYRIDIRGHQPTHVGAVAGTPFDYVISLCDKAREECPQFAGSPRRVHWSLPDPAAGTVTPRAAYAGFDHLAADLTTRIGYLLPALVPGFHDRGEFSAEFAGNSPRS
jgi:ArsR family transcriptional regulator, arsenate/arsenite/antimonite-responsive transcriptional repressor / arsenate reductase (thioredoxin)